MKVDRQQAIDFLKDIGFSNAPEWDDEKLSGRVALIPSRVGADEVNEPFAEFFKSLCDNDEKIELIGKKTDLKSVAERIFQPEGKPKTPAKPKAPKPKPTPKPDDEVPIGRVDRKKEPIVRRNPKKKKPAKRSSRPKVEKDDLGYRFGTLSAKVNKALSEEFQVEAAIVKKAGVSTAQARAHFYQLRDAGLLEIEKVVSYRLKKKS